MKHLTKKLLAFCVALFLACGCAAPSEDSSSLSSSPSSSDPEEPTWEEYDFRDLMGEPITPWSGKLQTLGLSYALVWEPGVEGYVRLEFDVHDEAWGGTTSFGTSSSYYLSPQKDGSFKLICNQTSYSFSCKTPIPGILQVDRYAILFYPYKSAKEPFYRVDPRTKDKEKTLLEKSTLSCVDGTVLEIKPLAVQLGANNNETILDLLGISDVSELSTPYWYDVEINFMDISVSGYSDNYWEILSTGALGYLELDDPITVKGELFLPERIWTGF